MPNHTRQNKKPKKKTSLGSAPNMQAAAHRTGFTFDLLSEAKNLGCKAFTLRGSVDCDEFIEWLEDGAQKEFREKWDEAGAIPSKETSQRIKEHYAAMEAKRKHQEKIEKLIPIATLRERMRTMSERQRPIAEEYIKDPVILARFCDEMSALVNEWNQQKVNL